jgi:thiol-disulfide isomerase/thioredoxin
MMKQLFCGWSCLFILVLLSLSSCGTENKGAVTGERKGALAFSPDEPEPGDSLHIVYNAAHPDAKYRDANALWLQVVVQTSRGGDMYRYALHRRDTSASVWEAAMLVPNDALVLAMSIHPFQMYMSEEGVTVGCYKDGKPARGSLPLLLSQARGFEQAKELFQLDEQLYPDDYKRWLYWWQGKIGSGFSRDSIEHEVDSLYRAMTSIHSAQDNAHSEGIVACAAAYSMLGKWQKSSEAIEVLQRNPRLDNGSFFFASMNMLVGSLNGSRKNGRWPGAEARELFSRLLTLAPESGNVGFMGDVVNILDSATVVDVARTSNLALLDSLEAMIFRDEYRSALCGNPGIAILLPENLLWLHQHRRADDVLQKSLLFLESLPEWESRYPRDRVSFVPLDGLKATGLYMRARAHITGSLGGEQELLATLLALPPTSLTKGAISLGAVFKVDAALKDRAIDTAKKYWVYAEKLNSPYAPALYDKVTTYSKEHRLAVESKEGIRKKYASTFTMNRTVSDIAIATQGGGVIYPRQVHDTLLVLMFTSESCSLCRQFFPQMARDFEALDIPKKILFISPDRLQETSRFYGRQYEYAPLTMPLQYQYEIQAYPTLIAIYNGKSIYRNEGLSTESARAAVPAVWQAVSIDESVAQ